MKTVKWWVFPLLSLVLIFGTVEIAKATGFWVSNGRQNVQAGQPLKATDLKGWMTIQQAADGLGMSAEELIAIMGPPAGVQLTPSMAFKDVEAVWPEFELSELRTKLAGDEVAAPAPSGKPTEAPSAGVTPGQPHTPQPDNGTPQARNATPGAGNATPGAGNGTPKAGKSAGSITGQLTLQQVADQAGIDVKALIKEAGLPENTSPTATLKSLRDSVPGFEIQRVRDAVTRLTAG